MKMISLRWSASGPFNESNAFGFITLNGVAVICQHGGSQWLCQSCADGIIKQYGKRQLTDQDMISNNGASNMKRELALKNIDQELSNIVHTLNDAAPPPRDPREVTEFEQIGEQLAKSLLVGAQDMLTVAQNHVKECEAFAEQLRAEIKKRADAHADLMIRLRTFGSTVLEAHQHFHDGKNA